jgi:hypothetical protein
VRRYRRLADDAPGRCPCGQQRVRSPHGR